MAGRQTTLEQTKTNSHEWTPLRSSGEHKNSEEIEHDIDRTRREMDGTMDALSDRFHPKRFIDYFFDMMQSPGSREKTRETMQDIGGRLGESIRDNPFPAMLIGAGAGWIFWNMQHHGGYDYGPSLQERARHGTSGLMDKMKSAAGSAKESVGQAFESARDRVQSAADSARERSGKVHEGYERSRERSVDIIRDHPLAAGFAAMAAGVLSGLAFPSARAGRPMAEAESGKTAESGESKVREAVESAGGELKSASEAVKSGMEKTVENAKEGMRKSSENLRTPGGEKSERSTEVWTTERRTAGVQRSDTESDVSRFGETGPAPDDEARRRAQRDENR